MNDLGRSTSVDQIIVPFENNAFPQSFAAGHGLSASTTAVDKAYQNHDEQAGGTHIAKPLQALDLSIYCRLQKKIRSRRQKQVRWNNYFFEKIFRSFINLKSLVVVQDEATKNGFQLYRSTTVVLLLFVSSTYTPSPRMPPLRSTPQVCIDSPLRCTWYIIAARALSPGAFFHRNNITLPSQYLILRGTSATLATTTAVQSSCQNDAALVTYYIGTTAVLDGTSRFL